MAIIAWDCNPSSVVTFSSPITSLCYMSITRSYHRQKLNWFSSGDNQTSLSCLLVSFDSGYKNNFEERSEQQESDNEFKIKKENFKFWKHVLTETWNFCLLQYKYRRCALKREQILWIFFVKLKTGVFIWKPNRKHTASINALGQFFIGQQFVIWFQTNGFVILERQRNRPYKIVELMLLLLLPITYRWLDHNNLWDNIL